MPGAPTKNVNAVTSGLYTRTPSRRVSLKGAMSAGTLAPYVQDLGDASLWIAETLATKAETGEGQQLASLYATVAHEMFQLQAEMQGVTGIKPASLGRLSEDGFNALIMKQRAALELVLSQITTAVQRVRDVESIEGTGVILDEVVNPVLRYLAGHIRMAKRMMRDMAANWAWQQAAEREDDGLTARLLQAIREAR